MEGYLVLLIFEDNIDQDFFVWHHQPTKTPMKCFVSCKEWHMPVKSTTPSLRQHFQLRGFFLKKCTKHLPWALAGAEGGCVESQTGFCAAEKVNALFFFQSKLKSAQEQNKLSANRKGKKNLFHQEKRCNKLWLETWTDGLRFCRDRCRTRGGNNRRVKKHAKKKEEKVTHDKQKHPDTNQIKATFHQFARFWLHLSQF